MSHSDIEIGHLLNSVDAARLEHVLSDLGAHDIQPWVLTGGLAIEIHCRLGGQSASPRPLNDLDFIVGSFEELPATLADHFVFRHVHPFDPPARLILQMIHPAQSLRVDVFRACAGSLRRAMDIRLNGRTARLVSLEDLIARIARLVMDLAGDVPVPSKHARDLLRLMQLRDASAVQAAWEEQKKPGHPADFDGVWKLLQSLISSRRDLLSTPQYSTDIDELCTRCSPSSSFPLAEPGLMLQLLGYC